MAMILASDRIIAGYLDTFNRFSQARFAHSRILRRSLRIQPLDIYQPVKISTPLPQSRRRVSVILFSLWVKYFPPLFLGRAETPRAMEVGAAYNSRTVEEVFRDFKARRAALLKALTTDVRLFFQQCDPEKENLCLYGDPSGEWRVNLPADEVPPEIPEPALGINFARDGMQEKDWLALVAAHSDAWLLAVAFYFGGRFQFDKNDRKRLFNMINELPTIYETVTGSANKVKEKATNANHGSHKSKSTSKSASESNGKNAKVKQAMEDYEDGTEDEDENEEEVDDDGDDDEHGETLCGACGDNYSSDEFWIGCDICEKWFHGKCVNITPARAEHIKQYKCPSCSNKRARH